MRRRAGGLSQFYSNNELIELSRITGADLNLLANLTPSSTGILMSTPV